MDVMLTTNLKLINSKLDTILESKIKALNSLDNKEGIEELTININNLKFIKRDKQQKIVKRNRRSSTPIYIPNKRKYI